MENKSRALSNETAVREEGSARRLCGLKMADGETSLGMAFSGGSDMEEPAAKRSKICPITNNGFKVAHEDRPPCFSVAKESREAAINCTQTAEKEAKPAMAVEQAPAAPGGDNNGLGLLDFEPLIPVAKREDSAGMSRDGRLTKLQVFTRTVVGKACFF